MIMLRREQIQRRAARATACTGLLFAGLTALAFAGDAHAGVAVHADALCMASPRVEGLKSYSIDMGGVQRRYTVFVPRSYQADRPAAAVIDIHGSGSNPQQELAISGLAAAAEARGFVVLLPEATTPFASGGFTWNIPQERGRPDDVKYIREVIEDVTQRLCIDEARLFAMGFSGGARLASSAVCILSRQFAALGAVGGLRSPGACDSPMPVIAFHGDADPINPYGGGGPSYWRESVDAALQAWAARNECDGQPSRTTVGPSVERITYSDCARGAEVTLYRLEGAGHVWPGSSAPLPAERFGASSRNVDATALILAFFERYGLPRETHGHVAESSASHATAARSGAQSQ